MEPIFGNSNSRFARAIRNFNVETARDPNGVHYDVYAVYDAYDVYDVYGVYTEGGEDGAIALKACNGKTTFPQWLVDKYIPADYRVVLTGGSVNAWHGKLYAKMDSKLMRLLEIHFVEWDAWAD
jgi:hypothetical protein